MKTFKKYAAQGEIDIEKLDAMPCLSKLKKLDAINGKYIIGHSETGHHHVLEADHAEVYEGRTAEGMAILYALIKHPTSLDHLRSFDTHESIGFDANDIVSFQSGEEYDPHAGTRRSQAD